MSGRGASYQRSFAGFFGSLIVLLLVVAAFVIFRDSVRGDVPEQDRAIDYTQSLAGFREAADFPLLAPEELPQGWIATSARFNNARPQTWHLGLLTEDEDYVGLEQSVDSIPTMVDKYVDTEAEPAGERTIAGEVWAAFTDARGDHALVREADGVTTLVVSPLGFTELEAFVTSLRAD